MIIPINGSIENTLNYVESKIIEARFPHNIFHTINKTKKGANKTGLNSEIAAMVNVFQDNGYFKQEFTFKDIFKSFGVYTRPIWNTIKSFRYIVKPIFRKKKMM